MSYAYDGSFDATFYEQSRYDGTPLDGRNRRVLARQRLHHALRIEAGDDVADKLAEPERYVDSTDADDAIWTAGRTESPFERLAKQLVSKHISEYDDPLTSRW